MPKTKPEIAWLAPCSSSFPMAIALMLILAATASCPRGHSAGNTPLTLGVGTNHTERIPGLTRVAVADSKLVRVKAIPPSELLFTGIKAGSTTVRVWTDQGQHLYEVEILPPNLYRQHASADPGEVIKISIEFLELDSSVGSEVGIHWPTTLQAMGSAGWQGTLDTSGLNYSVSFSSSKALVQFLRSSGWAKVLARPELFVRLGEEAHFQSGGEFAVATSSENYGRYHRHVEWKAYGLSVKVRPQSGDSFNINSDIRIEISEPDSSTQIDGIPSLVRRQLDTKMSSQDGEMVVLSGLVRQSDSKRSDSVPILGSIPIIGSLLFSHTQRSTRETEIIIVMTLSFSTRGGEKQRIRTLRERIDANID